MTTHTRKNLPKNTVELLVTVPKALIEAEYEKAFKKLSMALKVEGFRPGKAPMAMAKAQIKKEDVYQLLIRDLFPRIVADLVQKEALHPIVSPRIELKKAKEQEDWEIGVTVAQRPVVKLGDYKAIIQKAKSAAVKDDIWVPGKDKEKNAEAEKEREQKLMNAILSDFLKEVPVEISDLILDEEVNARLTRLLDDIQKIGLTAESYLNSKNLTMEKLKEQLRKETHETYALEYILAAVADAEAVEVQPEELEKVFATITDEKEKSMARQNSYFYASILRKQKTLEKILSL